MYGVTTRLGGFKVQAVEGQIGCIKESQSVCFDLREIVNTRKLHLNDPTTDWNYINME